MVVADFGEERGNVAVSSSKGGWEKGRREGEGEEEEGAALL